MPWVPAFRMEHTMAYSPSALAPRDLVFPKSQPQRATRGFWRRVFDAMVASRQRQVEREIARYLGDTGFKFTDEAEREIETRILGNHSRW